MEKVVETHHVAKNNIFRNDDLEKVVEEKYNYLLSIRKAAFMNCFIDNKTNKQINIVANKNEIPMKNHS